MWVISNKLCHSSFDATDGCVGVGDGWRRPPERCNRLLVHMRVRCDGLVCLLTSARCGL
jgi:hypothetical protein